MKSKIALLMSSVVLVSLVFSAIPMSTIQAQQSSPPVLATVLVTIPLYSEPRANSNQVGTLLSGQTWYVLGTDTTGRWVKIQVGAIATGWAVRAAFNLAGVQLPIFAGITGGSAPGIFRFGTARARFVYVVRRGDTLGKLALRYRTSVRAIANANRIRNINLIYVGQTLVIP